MTALATPARLERLSELRQRCLQTLAGLKTPLCHHQPLPELSPLAWHIGHSHFVETYWLAEVVFGDDRETAPLHALYFPERSPKRLRGKNLPPPNQLQQWCRKIAEHNDRLWAEVLAGKRPHRLLDNGYLLLFIIQHYAQHLETMQMVRHQLELSLNDEPGGRIRPILAGTGDMIRLPAATLKWRASDDVSAYDNELGEHHLSLPPISIARRPVSNGQWLAFMLAGGYEDDRWWSKPGRAWRESSGAKAPTHWRRTGKDQWHALEHTATDADVSNLPVHGINHYEANAYAAWAGTRLPHEHEWRYAVESGRAEQTGEVWEWCANALYPFPGFKAFPYDNYSLPWFDGRHVVLKGGSRLTEPELRRTSFRNFYPRAHRHVFAGLRLAYPD